MSCLSLLLLQAFKENQDLMLCLYGKVLVSIGKYEYKMIEIVWMIKPWKATYIGCALMEVQQQFDFVFKYLLLYLHFHILRVLRFIVNSCPGARAPCSNKIIYTREMSPYVSSVQ
jgi:hypothetical protein